VSGCPKALDVNVLVQDPSLAVDIDEMRKADKETNVEDFTMLDED
jgi:E3 SUMO-protein ligase NSE2